MLCRLARPAAAACHGKSPEGESRSVYARIGVVAGKFPARQGIPRTARVPRLYALRGYPHQRLGDGRGVGARWRMVEGGPPQSPFAPRVARLLLHGSTSGAHQTRLSLVA
jgi:hypothetical protein